MASGRLSWPRTFFTAAIAASRSSSVPWEKLIRKTSTPCSASAWIISSEFVAGPSVATILVRLTFTLSGMHSSMVRIQIVYLEYMIVQGCLAQMKKDTDVCPWSESGVTGTYLIAISLLEASGRSTHAVSYTHLRAHETRHDLVCRLLLE